MYKLAERIDCFMYRPRLCIMEVMNLVGFLDALAVGNHPLAILHFSLGMFSLLVRVIQSS